jgi:aspartate beta-hydroxylase
MSALPERFAQYIATLRDAGDRPSLAQYPGLRAQAWHDAATISLARDLTIAAQQIDAEYRALDPAAFAPEREPIARRGAWDVIMLYERGRPGGAFDACPVLAAILERNRTVRSLAGLAYFSRLGPHARVAPHRGPTNMRVRVHLGIDVPPDCGIRAGDESRSWTAGACLAFEDGFEHEVWNESDRERIILVADIWHPDLDDDEVRLLDGLHRYIARAAEGLDRYWSLNRE